MRILHATPTARTAPKRPAAHPRPGPLYGLVEVVAVPVWCPLKLLEDFVGAPNATIRHPFEVLTSSTGRSDAVWPLAPDRVMAEALDPWTLIDPTASVG